jgi:hypothetical protein
LINLYSGNGTYRERTTYDDGEDVYLKPNAVADEATRIGRLGSVAEFANHSSRVQSSANITNTALLPNTLSDSQTRLKQTVSTSNVVQIDGSFVSTNHRRSITTNDLLTQNTGFLPTIQQPGRSSSSDIGSSEGNSQQGVNLIGRHNPLITVKASSKDTALPWFDGMKDFENGSKMSLSVNGDPRTLSRFTNREGIEDDQEDYPEDNQEDDPENLDIAVSCTGLVNIDTRQTKKKIGGIFTKIASRCPICGAAEAY